MTSVSTAPPPVAAELAALPLAAQAQLLELYKIQAAMTDAERVLAAELVQAQGRAALALMTHPLPDAGPAVALFVGINALLVIDVDPADAGEEVCS